MLPDHVSPDSSIGPRLLSSDTSRRAENITPFEHGIEQSWGPHELSAFLEEPLPNAVRVLAVRHGMGKHNDLSGVLSVFNRDASLNEIGFRQSRIAGEALRESGSLALIDLVVVSPFTRALQTAAGMLGEGASGIPTIVQPLCAEHTLLRSALQQGDRGSTAQELEQAFPKSEFPQYDFSSVESYCAERGLRGGTWWAHREGELWESREDFARRCEEFKLWLGRECSTRGAQRVLLVSHGGLFRKGFGWSQPTNCEWRTLDVWADGAFSFSSVGIDHSESIDGTVYYQVRMGKCKPVMRRYSEFRALMASLTQAELKDFYALFPPRTTQKGRLPQLIAWIQQVVFLHRRECVVKTFFDTPPDTSPL